MTRSKKIIVAAAIAIAGTLGVTGVATAHNHDGYRHGHGHHHRGHHHGDNILRELLRAL